MKVSSYKIMCVLDDYNDNIITRDEMVSSLGFPTDEEMFEMYKHYTTTREKTEKSNLYVNGEVWNG